MNPAQYDIMARVEDAHFWFAGKRAFVGAMLDRFRRRDLSILDIGCGTGGTTSFLGRWGAVVGVEPSPLARRLARRRGVRVVAASAEKLPFRANSFDLVTLFDVLYHRNVCELRALKEASRVLKRGGTLVVTDCAIPWLWSKHDEATYAKRRYWKRELEALVAAAGFEIHKSSYIFATTFPLFALSRLLMRWLRPVHFVRIPPWPINRFIIEVFGWEARVLPYVNFPVGSSIIIVAKKSVKGKNYFVRH